MLAGWTETGVISVELKVVTHGCHMGPGHLLINLLSLLHKLPQTSWVPVTHTCNPSYSGGRDQENHGWKPAQANSS
jgi:hypothetical protein